MSAQQEVERGNWSDMQPQSARHPYRLPSCQEKPLSPPGHSQQQRLYQPPPPPPPQQHPQLQPQPAQPPPPQQQQDHQLQQQQQKQPLPPPPHQQPPAQQQSVVTLPRPPPPPPPPYAQPHHPVQPVQPVPSVPLPASQPAPTWHCDEATARLRTEEDRHAHEAFVRKAHKISERLRGLGERRSFLENELAALNASVAMTEKELEAAQEQYHAAIARLQHERVLQDRHKWMDPSRRASNRDMGSQPQQPAAGGWTSINGARPRAHDDDEDPPADPGNLLGKGYRPVEESDANGRVRLPGVANGQTTDVDDLEQGLAYRPRKADEPRLLKPKQQRHSLPGFSAVNRGSPKHEIPLEPKARSPSGRRSLPAARGHAAPSEPEEPVDDTEINQETFILKHDGKMYTEPAMYYGVPLERISPDHPYWDPGWQPLEDIIKPQLEKWQEKLTLLRQTPDAVRHTVFLANRQVNRGQAVVDFLKDGDFHPYQYVGKEMMDKFYKTFINYDTMFRLVNIHEELKKFDLDLTPLEWLRQRMYEVSQAQGDKFSLSKYTHDLYHDPKLKQLREKHGFGNIGRPSGYKIGEKNPDKGKTKVKRESAGGTRRKNRRSIGQVDMDEPSLVEAHYYHQMHHQQYPLAHGEFLDPQTPRLQKRPRIDAPPVVFKAERTPEPVVDDLECDGYTSTDSFSAGRISHLDFRVYQVKSPALTTSTEVTQYWTWDQDKELFEHQVLRDVHPKVTWGYYQKSANFDIKLDELLQIQYAVEDQKVIVSTKDDSRPVVMAHLKRERTKRRFLAFVKKRGVKIVKTNAALIETAWNDMKSNDTLPAESESPSS